MISIYSGMTSQQIHFKMLNGIDKCSNLQLCWCIPCLGCIGLPTGVASYTIDGHTLHSLFNLPTKGDFKELQGQALQTIQQSFLEVRYVIIDEMSMMGRKRNLL